MKMTGARMVVEALAVEGVKYVFGIPGGSVIPLYDALYDAPFTHVLMRHEQAAAHAADGYARASGKPGVCICTSGPGFTNILTGLATAYMDSVPLVAISGQVATHLIGTDAFQESDTFGSSLAAVKHSFLVRSVEELPGALKGAFEIAVSGRPGPVLIDLPVNIQRTEGEFNYPRESLFGGNRLSPRTDLSMAGKAADLLAGAERPVILAGGGVLASGASAHLLSFAEKRGIPVANTLMGKSAFPDNHPLSLGMAGMHGTPWANLALTEADVIFALGTRFSDRTTGKLDSFAKGAALIHGDIDEAEIDKIVPSQVSLLGDAKAILEALEAKTPPACRGSWAEKISGWKETYPISDPEDREFVPSAILERVKGSSGENWPAVADVGQNQMWTALFYKTSRPGAFLTSGGLGTMGYALPAAMGASLAGGKTPAVCFAGDGGFLMNCQELETCARYNIPVKIFVLNNHALGMVRQWQELFWDERYSATTPQSPCRFDALAEALGVKGYGCDTLDELEEMLPEMMNSPGPALVDCRIAREELILPMVPAGAALKDFLHRVKV